MTSRRPIGNFLALCGLFASSQLPDSMARDGLRYLSLGYIGIALVLRARAGYLRRRPYWTQESWRRYLTACTIPVGALVIVACFLVALEWRLPILGAAYSTTRSIWAAASIVFMVIGALGVVAAIEWLAKGDPSRPFAWPHWPGRGTGSAA